jgi:hypothetical protein
MEKGRWAESFKASSRLRSHEIQAARDMYYAAKLLEVEAAERQGKSLWKEFFGVRRNCRAAQSAFFVMFMQQVSSLPVLNFLAAANIAHIRPSLFVLRETKPSPC